MENCDSSVHLVWWGRRQTRDTVRPPGPTENRGESSPPQEGKGDGDFTWTQPSLPPTVLRLEEGFKVKRQRVR